ncbi:MAG: low molecular weight phosphatase family protein [Alphaproteobacteria bacterium]|nr:low molecular weight phosphatase family protein [Alphaproteobacteria bacterium]
MRDLPSAVLFACTYNAVRSPMAEGLMKRLFGTRIFVDSAGVKAGALDGFMIAVMEEEGIDMTRHKSKIFEQLEDTSYDLVISLSPQAQHKAVELTRTMACEVEFWPTLDCTVIEGDRETRLEAYRKVRDDLKQRLIKRFMPARMADL